MDFSTAKKIHFYNTPYYFSCSAFFYSPALYEDDLLSWLRCRCEWMDFTANNFEAAAVGRYLDWKMMCNINILSCAVVLNVGLVTDNTKRVAGCPAASRNGTLKWRKCTHFATSHEFGFVEIVPGRPRDTMTKWVQLPVTSITMQAEKEFLMGSSMEMSRIHDCFQEKRVNRTWIPHCAGGAL